MFSFYTLVGRNAHQFVSSVLWAGVTAGVMALVKANGRQFCSRPRLCGLIWNLQTECHIKRLHYCTILYQYTGILPVYYQYTTELRSVLLMELFKGLWIPQNILFVEIVVYVLEKIINVNCCKKIKSTLYLSCKKNKSTLYLSCNSVIIMS